MVAVNCQGREKFLWEVSKFDIGCKRVFRLEYIFNQGVQPLKRGCDTQKVSRLTGMNMIRGTSLIPVSSAPSGGLYVGMDAMTRMIVIVVGFFRSQIARVFG